MAASARSLHMFSRSEVKTPWAAGQTHLDNGLIPARTLGTVFNIGIEMSTPFKVMRGQLGGAVILASLTKGDDIPASHCCHSGCPTPRGPLPTPDAR